jgi:hypothetical protein
VQRPGFTPIKRKKNNTVMEELGVVIPLLEPINP